MSRSGSEVGMTPLRAIVFDAFETLYSNTRSHWRQTFQEVCKIQQLPIDPEALRSEWVQVEGAFRRSRTRLDDISATPPFVTYREAWRSSFQQTFDKFGIPGDATAAADAAVRNMGRRPPYEDAAHVLPLLRKGPWKMGLFSNADDDFLDPVLATWPLAAFDAKLSSESARVYKPHPAAFQAILERLDVTPQEAVYIGDHPYDDVHGAKLAGMRAVWLDRTGQAQRDPALNEPDYVITSLAELPPIVESLAEDGPHA